DTKLHALLDPTTVLNGQTFSRADYFAYYGGDGANGLGTKAAMVGWLLAEAEKADLGTYALSNDAFLTDVALHNAPFGVDLVGHYAQPGFVFNPG
ncbi:MAG TPA: alkaline metalloproteinase, partial [Phenylobacterium sp.]|nr:alkaline metalloproteinase [Phenylobacterium sp.]